jgi:hypothetical protein
MQADSQDASLFSYYLIISSTKNHTAHSLMAAHVLQQVQEAGLDCAHLPCVNPLGEANPAGSIESHEEMLTLK